MRCRKTVTHEQAFWVRCCICAEEEGRGWAPWGTEAQELDWGLRLPHPHREEIHTPQNQRMERMANVEGWAVYPNRRF